MIETSPGVKVLELELLAKVERGAQLTADAAFIKKELDIIKAELREAGLQVGDTGVRPDGTELVKVQANNAFDPERAVAFIADPDILKECLEPESYSSAALKAHLTLAQIQQCMVASGDAKVKFL